MLPSGLQAPVKAAHFTLAYLSLTALGRSQGLKQYCQSTQIPLCLLCIASHGIFQHLSNLRGAVKQRALHDVAGYLQSRTSLQSKLMADHQL